MLILLNARQDVTIANNTASSPYRGRGANGTDPGADFNTLRRLTAGVVK